MIPLFGAKVEAEFPPTSYFPFTTNVPPALASWRQSGGKDGELRPPSFAARGKEGSDPNYASTEISYYRSRRDTIFNTTTHPIK